MALLVFANKLLILTPYYTHTLIACRVMQLRLFFKVETLLNDAFNVAV